MPLIVEISGSTRMPAGSPSRMSPDTVLTVTAEPVQRRIVTSPDRGLDLGVAGDVVGLDVAGCQRGDQPATDGSDEDVAGRCLDGGIVAHQLEPGVARCDRDLGPHEVVGPDVARHRSNPQCAECSLTRRRRRKRP